MPWQLALGRDSRSAAALIRAFNAFSARRRVDRRANAACRPTVRRAYVAPYDALGQPHQHRCASCRTSRCAKAIAAWALVAAGGTARCRSSPTVRPSSAGACATSCSTGTSSTASARAAAGGSARVRRRQPLRARRQARRAGAGDPRVPRRASARRSDASRDASIATQSLLQSRMSQLDGTPCNIAACLPRAAREHPERIAMRCPGPQRALRRRADLRRSSTRAATRSPRAWRARGIVRGTRTVVMVRPTPEFFLLMFALFKAGAVPVLVDPGIDRRALKQCLDEAEPEAFIGIPLAHLARVLLGWAQVGARAHHHRRARAGWPMRRWRRSKRDGAQRAARRSWPTRSPTTSPRSCSPAAPPACPRAWSTATGISSRRSRCCAMRSASQPGGVDLPTFPPFALFDPALGLTSIIPDMDPTRPAQRRSAQAAAGDRALRRHPAVRLAGAGRRCWRDTARRCRRCKRVTVGRRAGAGRRGRAHARAAARRRAVVDARTAPPNACRWR